MKEAREQSFEIPAAYANRVQTFRPYRESRASFQSVVGFRSLYLNDQQLT